MLAAGAAVVAFALTRVFLDWNENNYQWRRIYLEVSFLGLLPATLGLVGLRQRSLFTFLLVALGAALTMAIVTGERYASPLGYDNADSLVVSVFVRTTLLSLALGMLLPLAAVVAWLWESEPRP